MDGEINSGRVEVQRLAGFNTSESVWTLPAHFTVIPAHLNARAKIICITSAQIICLCHLKNKEKYTLMFLISLYFKRADQSFPFATKEVADTKHPLELISEEKRAYFCTFWTCISY